MKNLFGNTSFSSERRKDSFCITVPLRMAEGNEEGKKEYFFGFDQGLNSRPPIQQS